MLRSPSVESTPPRGPVLGPRRPASARAAAVVVAVGCLLASAPTPAAAVVTLRAVLGDTPLPGGVPAGHDVTGPAVALVALLAWCLAGWLTVATVLTGCSHLPGTAGRLTGAVVRRMAPRTVRRALELALGLTVATGVACAGQASASYGGAGSGSLRHEAAGHQAVGHQAAGHQAAGHQAAGHEATPAEPARDGAHSTSLPAAPALDWPTTADRSAGEVVVAPGDTLWDLAERSLGDGATPTEVAQAWPTWWSANRDVIGADPDLLHPGDRLTPPPPATAAEPPAR